MFMLKCKNQLQRLVVLVLLLLSHASLAQAEEASDNSNLSHSSAPTPKLADDPRYQEIWKKSQVLRDQPVPDAAPISFSVGDVKYKVPRNYIVNMPDWGGGIQEGMVEIKVTYPGFQPLSEKTKQCLTQPRAYWPAGCTPVEFMIGGHTKFNDEESFRNGLEHWKDRTPKQGPNGLELYRDGPGSPTRKIELYRKQTPSSTIVVQCIFSGSEIPVCSRTSKITNKVSTFYFIDYDQLENIEAIDNGIRQFIETFTVKE
jgi:hypothetical protein